MELRRRVLVVDDEEGIRESLCASLADKGYLASSARTGKDALRLLSAELFDAILLDVSLPDISGYEVLKKLRSLSLDFSPAVVVITGLAAVGDTLNMLYLGVADYVIKGSDFCDAVVAKLHSCIGPSPVQSPERLRRLARLIRERKKSDVAPFTLVLGAGASLSSGCSSFSKIIFDLLTRIGGVSADELRRLSEEDKERRFDELFSEMGENDRRAFLTPHITHKRISQGYAILARLIKDGYFRTVVTTNLDNVLAHQLGLDGFTNVQVLIVGRDKEGHIEKSIRSNVGPVILKLHGDIEAGCYAFTRREIFQFNDTVENIVTELLGRDIVIVGHGMLDIDLVRCLRSDGGPIWCVNPSRPRHPLTTAMDCRKSGSFAIDDIYGRFDNFFTALEQYLYEG